MTFNTGPGTRGPRSRGSASALSRLVKSVVMRHHRKRWTYMGMDVLLLTTRGRKTGKPHTTPVAWFPAEGDTLLVVASAAGSADNPNWYYNIAVHPDRLTIELLDRTMSVAARQLAGPERQTAWERIIATQPRYADYQAKTDRVLPVIQLTPLST
jgi:deazaflavin-dependent oxidoreductase (nitroreductase family)